MNRRASQESTNSNNSTTQLLREDTINENETYTVEAGRLSPQIRVTMFLDLQSDPKIYSGKIQNMQILAPNL